MTTAVSPSPLRTLGHGGLLVLAIEVPTGGAAGSRAEEANNSRRWVQGPDGAAPRVVRGVVGRALDAAAESVTITGRQEATHPLHRAAA
jgi:hypothetical protein